MYGKYMSGQESPHLTDTRTVSICIFPAQWKAAPVLRYAGQGVPVLFFVVVFLLSPSCRGRVGVLHYFSPPCLAGGVCTIIINTII